MDGETVHLEAKWLSVRLAVVLRVALEGTVTAENACGLPGVYSKDSGYAYLVWLAPQDRNDLPKAVTKF